MKTPKPIRWERVEWSSFTNHGAESYSQSGFILCPVFRKRKADKASNVSPPAQNSAERVDEGVSFPTKDILDTLPIKFP